MEPPRARKENLGFAFPEAKTAERPHTTKSFYIACDPI